jgi:hypothetical protein
MKYIITESQLDIIIPPFLKRRLDIIEDLMYDVMLNNGMGLDAKEYSLNDFVNYVIDIMMYDIRPDTPEIELSDYRKALLFLLGDKIGEFWEENH